VEIIEIEDKKDRRASVKEKSTHTWLKKVTKKYRFFVVLLTVFEIIVSGLGICYALVLKQMVDRAVVKDSHGFVIGMIGFGMLVLGQLIIRIITRQISEYTRSSMENALKQILFHSILIKDYGSVSLKHSEEWMNRLTSDTVVCADGMTDILPGFFGMMIRLVGSLVLILYLQPGLAVIMIPGGILFVIITVVLRRPLKRFHKDVQEKDGKVRMYLQEWISSMLVVRVFGVENIAVEQAADTMEVHKGSRMRKAWISNICNSGFSLAINGMYLLGIGFCGYGIIHGNVTFGTLTAMIQLIGQLQSPLASLGGYVPRYYTMIASAERLMEVEQYEDADGAILYSADEVQKLYEEQIREITFRRVSFCYPGEVDTGSPTVRKGDVVAANSADTGIVEHKRDVLQDVSFSIAKGDSMAVTGTSGCGKSTMLKLLMGIYRPQTGTIAVILNDGKSIAIENMKRLFAYVPQGNFLMGGSVRDVITFGKSKDGTADCLKTDNADGDHADRNDMDLDEKLERAVHLACADFVYDLPMQLDTILGEKGAGLSEGQMQRIAIARALYADRPVLILDESTSALDQQTERKLLDNLKQLTDKTVLFVSHRLQALEICSKQLHFEEGMVQMKNKTE
jgi:ABC-type multidrug transport system fused ATPase/permease subunit